MKSTLLTGLLILLSYGVMRGQAGTDGMAFLKLGVGARSLSMGEAYTALANDPTATYYNPAALSLSDNSQVILMHREWIADTKTEYLAAQSTLWGLHVGIGVNATSVDDIEFRTVPGPPLGTFSSRNSSIGVSACYAWDSTFAIGATANYLYEKIFTYEAFGSGFNFGLLYRTPWDVRIGASINNIGSMDTLIDEATKLPTSIRVGAARTFPVESIQGSFTLAADMVSYTVESESHLQAGAELNYHDEFAVRLGYLTGYDARSFTGGIGVRSGFLTFDYAYAPFSNDFGTTNTFSLGFIF